MAGKSGRRKLSVGNPKPLLDWLRYGLAKPGKTVKGLAALLGKEPSAVSRLKSDERRFQVHELPIIEEYFGEPAPPALRAQLAPVESSSATARLGSEQALGAAVRVLVVIAPSVWREVGVAVAVTERVPASLEPRVVGMKQYACKIEAQEGRYAICVPYGDMRVRPLANDKVHVRRTDKQGRYEDTLRVVRITHGQVQLKIEGAKGNEAILNYPVPKDGGTIEIRGLVIGYHEVEKF